MDILLGRDPNGGTDDDGTGFTQLTACRTILNGC